MKICTICQKEADRLTKQKCDSCYFKAYYVARREHKIKLSKDHYNQVNYGGNRYKVLKRDGNRCKRCDITQSEHLELFNESLHVHHVDRNRFNNTLGNLETICVKCHGREHTAEAAKQRATNGYHRKLKFVINYEQLKTHLDLLRSLNQIAKIYGCSRQTIKCNMRKYNLVRYRSTERHNARFNNKQVYTDGLI